MSNKMVLISRLAVDKFGQLKTELSKKWLKVLQKESQGVFKMQTATVQWSA